MAELTIGELARRAGVATSALRYYEKAGLASSAATSLQSSAVRSRSNWSDTDYTSGA